jgi:hypothetical protein
MSYFIALLFVLPLIGLLKALKDAKAMSRRGLDWRVH